MTSMFIYFGFVVLVTMVTTILFKAEQRTVAVFVAGVGVAGVILRVANEAYDAVLETGRMEPFAALLGAGLVAIMVGVSLADALCDYLSRSDNKT